MSELDLSKSIRNRLKEVVKNMRLAPDNKKQEFRAPTVVNGYLAPKRSNEESDFPFLVVRPGKGETGTDGITKVDVKIIIGCYSEEFDGHEYAMQVLNRIRIGLMEKRTLDNMFRMELPFDWELYDDQPYPEWQMKLNTRWTIPTPQELPDEGVTGL
jgi:hypothetical protein